LIVLNKLYLSLGAIPNLGVLGSGFIYNSDASKYGNGVKGEGVPIHIFMQTIQQECKKLLRVVLLIASKLRGEPL
jgi:hypothetical protein